MNIMKYSCESKNENSDKNLNNSKTSNSLDDNSFSKGQNMNTLKNDNTIMNIMGYILSNSDENKLNYSYTENSFSGIIEEEKEIYEGSDKNNFYGKSHLNRKNNESENSEKTYPNDEYSKNSNILTNPSEFKDTRDAIDLINYNNKSKLRRKRDLSTLYQIVQGTMRQQTYNLNIEDDGIFLKNEKILMFDNNNNPSNINNNSSIEYILSIIEDNKTLKKNKRYSVYESKDPTAKLFIDDNYRNFFNYKARPSLPLTLIPSKDPNKYNYSFYYNTNIDSYYENDPPSIIKGNWIDGIQNIHLNIQKDLKYNYIFKDPIDIPFTLEIEWCFDFRPTNLLLDTMQLKVMQSDPYLRIFGNAMVNIKSIIWYTHIGLTSDIVNNNYISNIKRSEYSSNSVKDTNSSSKYQFSFEKNIHFNGIPVVSYDKNLNNSFLWQRIPEIDNQKERGDDTKFTLVDLTNSVVNQSGFLLKVVIKGDFDTKYFEEHNVENIHLFGGNNKYQIKECYEKKYRLFDFNCTLVPEFESNIYERNKMNNSKHTMSDSSINKNNQNFFLNDEETKDFTIIIPKVDEMNVNNKLNISQRAKCNINEKKLKVNLIVDDKTNNIKFFVHKEILNKSSEYFMNVLTSSNSLFCAEQEKNQLLIENADPISLYQILFFCYNDYFPDQNSYNMYDWMMLLTTSSQFQFQNILNYCECQLKKYIRKENINEISRVATKANAFQLDRYCYLFRMYYEIDEPSDDESYYDNESDKIIIKIEENSENKTISNERCNNNFKENISFNTWYKKIFGTLLWIGYIIIGELILFIFEHIMNVIVSIFIIILCVICQGILWPLIDSIKTFRILKVIINDYQKGIKNVYQQSIKKEKSLYNTNLITKNTAINPNGDMDDSCTENNDNNSKGKNNTYENNILKSTVMTKNEKNVQDFRNNFNFNNLIKISIFTLVVKDLINETKLVLPINYLQKRILLKTICHVWLHCLKSSIILCGRWWRILCFHTLGIYSIINPHIIDHSFIYERYRFFWCHKKSIIEEPHFY